MTSPFNINIKLLREARGLSQEALAEELGVSRQAVGHWESGRMYPQLCQAVKIAKMFGTTVEEMMIVKKDKAAFLSKFDHENEILPVK